MTIFDYNLFKLQDIFTNEREKQFGFLVVVYFPKVSTLKNHLEFIRKTPYLNGTNSYIKDALDYGMKLSRYVGNIIELKGDKEALVTINVTEINDPRIENDDTGRIEGETLFFGDLKAFVSQKHAHSEFEKRTEKTFPLFSIVNIHTVESISEDNYDDEEDSYNSTVEYNSDDSW